MGVSISYDLSIFVFCSIYGAGSCAEWAAEGRRLVPLMPRLVPQTVFSASATAAANSAAAANAKVPVSSGTSFRNQSHFVMVSMPFQNYFKLVCIFLYVRVMITVLKPSLKLLKINCSQV